MFMLGVYGQKQITLTGEKSLSQKYDAYIGINYCSDNLTVKDK